MWFLLNAPGQQQSRPPTCGILRIAKPEPDGPGPSAAATTAPIIPIKNFVAFNEQREHLSFSFEDLIKLLDGTDAVFTAEGDPVLQLSASSSSSSSKTSTNPTRIRAKFNAIELGMECNQPLDLLLAFCDEEGKTVYRLKLEGYAMEYKPIWMKAVANLSFVKHAV
jgi:hypothetical protein